MATAKIPISYINGQPHIPVTIINPSNKKSVTLNMLIDTGWQDDRIDLKYGIQLGFNPIDAIGGAAARLANKDYTTHVAQMKIGTLQPIVTYLKISTSNTGRNVFGALPMRQFEYFVITRTNVTAADSTTGGGTEQGLLNVSKDFNKYEFPGGVPKLVATAALAQALYSATAGSNSQARWRNRI